MKSSSVISFKYNLPTNTDGSWLCLAINYLVLRVNFHRKVAKLKRKVVNPPVWGCLAEKQSATQLVLRKKKVEKIATKKWGGISRYVVKKEQQKFENRFVKTIFEKNWFKSISRDRVKKRVN